MKLSTSLYPRGFTNLYWCFIVILIMTFTTTPVFAIVDQWDSNWGENGLITIIDENLDYDGRDIAFQEDGSIIVLSETQDFVGDNGYGTAVTRFTTSGVIDSTFGINGFYYFDTTDDDIPEGIHVDDNDNIYVTGKMVSATTADEDMFIFKLSPDGAVDTSFNEDGVYIHVNESGDDGGFDVIISAFSDSILVSGYLTEDQSTEDSQVAVWKFDSSGQLDTSFSDDGIFLFDNGDIYYRNKGMKIIEMSDGSLLIGGSCDDYSMRTVNYQISLWMITSEGELINSFDSDGYWIGNDYFYGMALDEENRILLLGYTDFGEEWTGLFLQRLLITGETDTDFDEDGGFILGTGGVLPLESYYGGGVITSPDDSLYVFAHSTDTSEVVLWRVLEDGTIDTDFGDGGSVTFSTDEVHTEFHSVDIMSTPENNGEIFLIGYSLNSESETYESTIWKYKYAYQIDNLSVGISALNSLGNNIEVGSEYGFIGLLETFMMQDSNNLLFGSILTNLVADLDWTGVSGEVDLITRRSVITVEDGTNGAILHALFVPKDETDDTLTICPEALTLDDVYFDCPSGVVYTVDSPGIEIYEFFGQDYWVYVNSPETGGISYRTLDESSLIDTSGVSLIMVTSFLTTIGLSTISIALFRKYQTEV